MSPCQMCATPDMCKNLGCAGEALEREKAGVSPIQPAVGGMRFDVLYEIAATFSLDYNAVCKCAASVLASTSPAQTGEPTEGNWISADDYYRNVKALDEALNGPGGATRPLLIDVLSQVEGEVRKRGAPILATGGVDQAWIEARIAEWLDEAIDFDAAGNALTRRRCISDQCGPLALNYIEYLSTALGAKP